MAYSASFSRSHIGPDPGPIDALYHEQSANRLRDVFHHSTSRRTVKAGCDLFSQGEREDAIYHLIDGWAMLYNLLEDGRRQILQFVLPGSTLAFIPAPGMTMTYGALALTDAVASVIPHATIKRLTRSDPEIGLQLAALIAQDRLLAYDHLSSIGHGSARERVAHLLLELFVRYRMQWPGHRTEEMHLPLTQEHIGDATGLTSVHVNRILRELKRDGIAEFHYRRLRILNPDKLVDAAGTDPARIFRGLDARTRSQNSARRDRTGDAHAFARPAAVQRRCLRSPDSKIIAVNTL